MMQFSQSSQITLIAVVLIYLGLNLILGLWFSRKKKSGKGFLNDYYIGGRSMGGLVLAMTLVATFTSASSFIGGPGVAASKGLAWVYLAMIQVPTAFIILGILGKKFAIISRKTGAVTVSDFLLARYRSKAVVLLASFALVLFFISQMVSQFYGGAVLFQTITGLDYIYGLLLFGLVVVGYTAFGGFKAVVTTDTIQGIVMVVGSVILLTTIVSVAGGFPAMTEKLHQVSPHYADITAGGSISKNWLLSFWALIGVGVLGLPQTAVRGMGFRDTRGLHSAIIYGTIVVGFLMLTMHIAGVFAPAVIDMEVLPSSDYLIPAVVARYMNPVVAGVFIAAPLAAVMSTVSSLLLLTSAALVKDLYINYYISEKKEKSSFFQIYISRVSTVVTVAIGLLVVLFSISPPDLIVWINLFAMGGLECAFLAPILFGLYWQRANAVGAIVSIICGISSYLLFYCTGWSFLGTHTIVPALAIAIGSFIVGTYCGKKPEKEVMQLFFTKKEK